MGLGMFNFLSAEDIAWKIIHEINHIGDSSGVIDDGTAKYTYDNGKLHRTDGPAVVDVSRVEWYFRGTKVNVNSQKEFETWLQFWRQSDIIMG